MAVIFQVMVLCVGGGGWKFVAVIKKNTAYTLRTPLKYCFFSAAVLEQKQQKQSECFVQTLASSH